MDTLHLSGVRASDVAIWGGGDRLFLGIGEETLTIENAFGEDGSLERIELDDGSVLTATAAAQLVDAMAGFAQGHGFEVDSPQQVAENKALMHMAASFWLGSGG